MTGTKQYRPDRGFTLIEVLVAVVILALLLVVALPGYQRQLLVARRALARGALMDLVTQQEHFFLEYKQYADSPVELGYPESAYAIDAYGRMVPSRSPARVYLIDMIAQPGVYVVYATPQLGQQRDVFCATLGLSSNGRKSVTGTHSVAQCW